METRRKFVQIIATLLLTKLVAAQTTFLTRMKNCYATETKSKNRYGIDLKSLMVTNWLRQGQRVNVVVHFLLSG